MNTQAKGLTKGKVVRGLFWEDLGRRVCTLVTLMLAAAAVMSLEKGVFMLVYRSNYSEAGLPAALRAIRAGVPMDLSVAGYLTAIPALTIIASLWIKKELTRRILGIYYIVVSFLISLIFLLDTVLYGFWGFKLDSTPLFYFFSSPAAAVASVEWFQIVLMLIGWTGYSMLLLKLFRRILAMMPEKDGRDAYPAVQTVILTLLTALMIIPMRGGVTVSTMNISSAYHSTDMRLNHAAVNPAFSLMYSLTHSKDFGKTARYMADSEAEATLAEAMPPAEPGDAAAWLTPGVTRPDIYVIILESFSSHLFPSLGGESIAMGLDSIARQGLSFTQCYAPGFRTDRGIPAVLSGYPCPPATSVMKYVETAENLPNIASSLASKGYKASYYYGGDINFTNQLAYLKAGGFTTIMSDKDWPVEERLSKWGVHDGPMLSRAWSEIKSASAPGSARSNTPQLRVIQTSSSHEPFEVPRHAPGVNAKVNAFAYTDECVTAFIDSLATLPGWGRTLVVITADHYGAYPPRPERMSDRHHVPLIMTGGALARRGSDATLSSHTDIAPTLMRLIGADPGPYQWGRSLTDKAPRRTVWLSEADELGALSASGLVIWPIDSKATANTKLHRAWLQQNYNYLKSHTHSLNQ